MIFYMPWRDGLRFALLILRARGGFIEKIKLTLASVLLCLTLQQAQADPATDTAPPPPSYDGPDWRDIVAGGALFGGVYVIGKQNNGEKILGTLYLLGAGMSHGGFSRAGGGVLAWLA